MTAQQTAEEIQRLIIEDLERNPDAMRVWVEAAQRPVEREAPGEAA